MDRSLGRLTLHQLRAFRAVARRRSFTRAAADLGLTQSAVSVQVRELGRLLGSPLFDVIGRSVRLTDAGRALERHAARAEGLVEEIGQEFAALRGADAGLVRIGASTSFGTYELPGLIGDFSASHPGVEVTLEIHNSAQVEQLLAEGGFDLGFVGSAPSSAALVGEPFLQDEIFFACAPSHRLAGGTAAPAALAAERVILREPGSGTRRAMEERLAGLGVCFARTMQLGSVEAIKNAVIAGLGISWFSGLTVRRELADRRLARIRVRGATVRRTFYVLRHRRKRETPSLAAFAAFARGRRDQAGR